MIRIDLLILGFVVASLVFLTMRVHMLSKDLETLKSSQEPTQSDDAPKHRAQARAQSESDSEEDGMEPYEEFDNDHAMHREPSIPSELVAQALQQAMETTHAENEISDDDDDESDNKSVLEDEEEAPP